MIEDVRAAIREAKWHRAQREEHDKALRGIGLREPLRCERCGDRGETERHKSMCSGHVWLIHDHTGRPAGVNLALWIAYQRDLIEQPLFSLSDEENLAWYDKGGRIAYAD